MVKKEEKDWHNTKRMKCLKKTLCLLNYQVQGSFCTEQWVFFLKKNFLHDHEYTWRNLIFQLNNTLCQCLSLQYSTANIYSDNECCLVEKNPPYSCDKHPTFISIMLPREVIPANLKAFNTHESLYSFTISISFFVCTIRCKEKIHKDI